MLSLLNPSFADDTTVVDYIEISKGEVAPFDGRLFTSQGIAKILADHEAEKSKLKIEFDYELNKTTLDLNLKYDVLDSRRQSEILMYETMLKARDEELNKAAKKNTLQKWAAYGSFVLGAATSVAIFYSVNHN